jgi:hypothetical protein
MESCLSERIVVMIIEGNPMKRHPVEAGVQQNSPGSPIVFAIYTSELIKWFKQAILSKEL